MLEVLLINVYNKQTTWQKEQLTERLINRKKKWRQDKLIERQSDKKTNWHKDKLTERQIAIIQSDKQISRQKDWNLGEV